MPGRAVAVAGVCGSLDPAVRPGAVVVASEVMVLVGSDAGSDAMTRTVARCPSAPLLARELQRAGLTVHVGPILSVGRLADGRDRQRLRRTGAVAVDMESAWLAEAAAGRPFAVVRAVSDAPGAELSNPVAAVTGGTRALLVLRRIGPALLRWAFAAGSRRVLLAGPRSFCAGVERAIEIVERALDRHGAPVYVRKQIVHNVHVVHELEGRGAVFVDEVDDVPEGSVVVFSAHGVSPEVRRRSAQRGLQVIDATCPLVTKVHTEARRFAGAGYTIFLIGHDGHEEVEGTTGEAPDAIRLVDPERDGLTALTQAGDPGRVAYLTQTTLAVDEVHHVVDAIGHRFPGLTGPGSDDICYATQNRQDAVKALAGACDLMLVIGSGNSSNSRRLVEVAERQGCPARLIDDEGDVDLAWLEGAGTVGLTAGASAPEVLVDRVIEAISGLGPVEVEERQVTEESVRFTLPVGLRVAGDLAGSQTANDRTE
jgi:4-hydroxy-3-methylbut-2-enyl diphosphate reductase